MTAEDGRPAEAGLISPVMRKVIECVGPLIAEYTNFRGEDCIHVRREDIVEVARKIRNAPELALDMLIDVTAVDYLGQPDGFAMEPEVWDRNKVLVRRVPPSRHCLVVPERGPSPRFAVVYHLLSTRHFHRLRIKCRVPEDDPTIPSVTGIWPGANWLERETYDLYGIQFTGHPDLRRIYLYDEFRGHPLRKDYGKLEEQPIQPFLGPAANEPRRPTD